MTLRFERQLLVVTFLMGFAGRGNCSLLDWIWTTAQEEKGSESDNFNTEQESLVPPLVQFEGKAEDKKFVEDVKKYTLTPQSEFDTCHREVIVKIKSTCLKATEEDLSKLSVNLLNCHSEQGGKTLFPCTEEMTLKECTQHMDAEMWTAYHVMNMKTRSMCYATRQLGLHDQNREKVNQLAEAVQHQFLTVLSVKEMQNGLEMMTYRTKDVMSHTRDVLHYHEENLGVMQEDLSKLFGLKVMDLVEIMISVKEKSRLYVQYRRDVEKTLESIREELMVKENAEKEEYLKLISAVELINQTVVATLQLIEVKVDVLQEQLFKLMVEREKLMDALSDMSTVLEPVDWLWQYVDYVTRIYENEEERGKLLQSLSMVLHIQVLLCSVLFCSLCDSGFLSHAFTLAVYVNILVMFVFSKTPTLDLHTLIAAFAFLRSVQWFVTYLYNFLQPSEDTIGSVYVLDDDTFGAISTGRGVCSSAKDCVEDLISKFWQQVQTMFKKTKTLKTLDKLDDAYDSDREDDGDNAYIGRGDDVAFADDDKYNELKKDDDLLENGSSKSRPLSPVGKQLGMQRSTPSKQLPERTL